MHNLPLLDRLARLKATYILGNHDNDLAAFIGTGLLCHPFFDRMVDATAKPYVLTVGGKTVKFMHGHEVDPFNADPAPGWGRMLAVFAGIFEERNGSPMLPSGESVEETLEGFGEALLRVWNWLTNKLKRPVSGGDSPSPRKELTPAQNPERAAEMLAGYYANRKAEGYDVAVVGHTHQPGWVGDWYVNAGSWATTNNEVVQIAPDGKITLCEAEDGKLIPLSTNPLKDAQVPQA